MSLDPPGSFARSHPSSSLLNPAVGDDGSSSPPLLPPPSPWPTLVLDSGVDFHIVGDPRLLSNLRDAPAGTTFRTSNGTTLPITKIGDILMTTAGFRIPGVSLVPGHKFNVVSVRELARQSRICTWFDGDRAMLYAGHELVGVAVAHQENLFGFYVLQFLRMQLPERFPWNQFLPLRVHTGKQHRLRIHMLEQLRRRIHRQKGLLPMHGDNSISSSPSGPPKLVLDSGAGCHMVSDPRLLSNLRDAQAGQMVVAGDGNTMPITKIGGIHIQGLTIADIRLVPGLKFDGLISVRQLARESRICTWFSGDRAKLYAGPKLVGVAVSSPENLGGLYILRTPKIRAA